MLTRWRCAYVGRFVVGSGVRYGYCGADGTDDEDNKLEKLRQGGVIGCLFLLVVTSARLYKLHYNTIV